MERLTEKLTWEELEAQGVQRCCAIYKSGKQCRRRAIEGKSFCEPHGKIMDRYDHQRERAEKESE